MVCQVALIAKKTLKKLWGWEVGILFICVGLYVSRLENQSESLRHVIRHIGDDAIWKKFMREGFKIVCCKIEEGNQLLDLGLERDGGL